MVNIGIRTRIKWIPDGFEIREEIHPLNGVVVDLQRRNNIIFVGDDNSAVIMQNTIYTEGSALFAGYFDTYFIGYRIWSFDYTNGHTLYRYLPGPFVGNRSLVFSYPGDISTPYYLPFFIANHMESGQPDPCWRKRLGYSGCFA